jgi:NAD(P)-dependent dehydrogenase (short-subunit alcohol dehydrogenase family)
MWPMSGRDVAATFALDTPERRWLDNNDQDSEEDMARDGEVVVVTGASSGIGRSIAREFGRSGARVALVARGEEGLRAAKGEIEAAGGQAIIVPTDVADPEAVEAAAVAAEDAFGPIDIWVNVAMTTVFSWFEDIEPEEFRRATDVSYHGFVWGTRAALKRMRPRDRGTIVQVGSAMAYRGIPLQSPYCGAKHAIRGFQESLRTELRHQGSRVHVTMVQLPGVNTPQFDHCLCKLPNKPIPVAPIYQPEVAARAVYWAAHHRRRELWVGVPTVYTVLGNKLSPLVAEIYLAKTAVGGQQTNQPVSPDRQANLFEPPSGDAGAHGDYDDKAHAHSPQSWASLHRRSLLAGCAAVAGVVVGTQVTR